VNYCSVCDRELPDDARDCRYCGAPSTAVMGGLRQGDQWESLADDGRGPLLRDDDLDESDRRPAGRESDPRWDDVSATAGAIELTGAGLSYRLPAKLIDIALRLGIVVLLVRLVESDQRPWDVRPTMGESLLGVVYGLVFLFALVGYPIVFEATLGRTPGKAAVGLRVLTESGDRCGWRGAAIRNVTMEVVGFWMLLVGGLFFVATLATDPRHRHAADRWAGTVVVSLSGREAL
jgi:uncharacterized RDD family membrane protein YckC